ncbi:hypothetical protein [Geminicoccus flavidas]|uniref:hypothetical protein n=1 Tax=Geminicoccus flavidas TaxID=2506407 RepID=UPI00190F6689|nr:hypothetical protein [Geminicoccus flavidas]
MMLGEDAPSTAVIEFVTGSPFGMQLTGGSVPFFDPYGWTPEAGFDKALAALGWMSTIRKGKNATDALKQLIAALKAGPVWVGPLEIGHLRHQPGKTGPIGADHYLVVLAADDTRVLMHDPQGYPYVTLPLADFMAAWRAETIGYGEPFTMRTNFRRVREVRADEVIRASLPTAIQWLSMEGDREVAPGSLGNGEAAERLAALVEAGCDDELRGHLIHFAVRVGARRLGDAATCLARVDYVNAARIAAEQAQLVGSMQYPLATGDDAAAASAVRALALPYTQLLSALC